MEAYTAADALAAADVTRFDVDNWTRRGGLVLPILDPRPGRARRYSRANVYELVLVKALINSGVSLAEATYLIRDRFGFILETRARELGRDVPDIEAMTTDPELLGLELTNRDSENPVCWIVTPGERGRLPELQGSRERSLGATLAALRQRMHPVTSATVITVSEILAAVDARLAGKSWPAGRDEAAAERAFAADRRGGAEAQHAESED